MKIDEGTLRRLVHNLLKEQQFLYENIEDISAAAKKGLADMEQAMEDEKDMSKRLKSKSDATPSALKKIVDGAKKEGEGKNDMERIEAELRYYSLRGVTYQLRNGKGTYTIKTLDGETTTLVAAAVGNSPSEDLQKAAKSVKSVSQSASKAASKVSKAPTTSNKTDQIKFIQKAIGTKDDGDWGKNTDAKWEEWIVSDDVTKAIEKIIGTSDSSSQSSEEPGESPSEPMESDAETGEESANESMNRLQLRNLLETMAYFPYLNEEPDAMSNPDEGGSEPEKLKYRVSAGFQDNGEKFYTFIKFPHNMKKKTNTLPKKDVESLIKTLGPEAAGGTFDNDQAVQLATTLLGSGTTEDNVHSLTGEKGKEEQNKGIGREALIALAKKAVESFNKGPEKSSEKGKEKTDKKSPPARDDMGRQGKMGEIAKNRGNAAAIAKMLGFEGTLAGVAKAVEKIKDNMPKQVSENRKLFNTLVKYNII